MSGHYLNSPRPDDGKDDIHSPGYREKWGDMARKELSVENISAAIYRIHKQTVDNSLNVYANLHQKANCDRIAHALVEGTISPVISILEK